jgi:DNA-binding response OmpR family regulator
VALTSRETALARCLFQTPGGLVSRRRLAHIWEADEDIASRSIEQHVYQLRRKLKRCVGDAVVLRSVYARGYQLECLAVPRAA